MSCTEYCVSSSPERPPRSRTCPWKGCIRSPWSAAGCARPGSTALPDDGALRRRIAWLTLLAPFELLVGDHFRGRAAELARLRAYAGVLAPGSPEVAGAPPPTRTRRWCRW